MTKTPNITKTLTKMTYKNKIIKYIIGSII